MITILIRLKKETIKYSFPRKGIRFLVVAMYCLIKYEEMSVVKE